MPFTVKDLIGDRPLPVTAKQDEPVEAVLERMLLHDYTQLPVVDGGSEPIGMITSNSILRTLMHLEVPMKALRVREAMDSRPLRKYRSTEDADLSELLELLRDTSAVLIVDATGRLTAIVNSYDTTEFFQRKAEDIMLVEDIELSLKEMIRSAHTNEAGETNEASLETLIASMAGSRQEKRKSAVKLLQRYLAEAGAANVSFDKALFDKVFDQVHADPAPRSLDKLSFNDFIQILLHESRWSFFHEAFGLERDAIRRMLEGARNTRNALAHFRGAISPSERDRLRFCVEKITQVQQKLAPRHTNAPRLEATVAPGEGTGEEELESEVEDLGQGTSRYAPIAAWLRSQSKALERVELSFAEVEEIMGGDLPAAAQQHRSWWSNDAHRHVQSRGWLDVSWRVASVNLGEERVTFARSRERERLYIDFYGELLGALREKANFALRKASPDGQSWVWVAGVPEGGQVAYLSFSFALRDRFRVELYIDSGDAAYNKQVFDALHEQREAIEAAFGGSLEWERLDKRRASRVAAYHSGAITDGETVLKELRAWALDAMLRLQGAMEPRLREATRRLAS
ncbi:DUF4268 domain-containing protein [Archangium sp.]|uniref:DUF4268 domain-containing protein n=1 Tax=Archangium sp. TaxID=1872627 RepID=UPI00286CB6E9|nr:DUF4268 domain-containing protein [Archangium sp.]